MRNLIKKILKEEIEDHSNIKVGDMFEIPEIKRVVIIDKIICDNSRKGTYTHNSDKWGRIEFYDDGCDVIFKISDEGKTWDEYGYTMEKGWADVLIEKGEWIKAVDNDIQFFD